jgi:ribosomal protein S27E
MLISDFTVPELDHLRVNCNFVGNEKEVFELRSQGIPIERIAEQLNMSVGGINKISQKVNRKINKVV